MTGQKSMALLTFKESEHIDKFTVFVTFIALLATQGTNILTQCLLDTCNIPEYQISIR